MHVFTVFICILFISESRSKPDRKSGRNINPVIWEKTCRQYVGNLPNRLFVILEQPVVGVLDEPYSELTPLSGVAVQAPQST
jgi:hypothetical protein